MLSVLIPTLNEARNIADCVSSVLWADEVILVDSGSIDGTQDLARKAGASVVDFNWDRRFPKKKNWALDNLALKHEWVLIVDADERITPELASEIQAEIRAPRADGYLINRRFMFMGKWIQHCGYSPSWNLRLFRHKLGRYEKLHAGDTGSGDNEVHEHVVLQGRAGHLRHEMLHYAYPDIYTWMEKHNRYSNWEAQVEISDKAAGLVGQGIGVQFRKRRALREWSRRMPFRPTLRFVYNYILRGGFLDGHEGFIFCRLLATYEMLSLYKAHELRQRRISDRAQ